MIVPSDHKTFLESIIGSTSYFGAALITGPKESRKQFTETLSGFLLCNNKSFCKQCDGCLYGSALDRRIFSGKELPIEIAREIQSEAGQTSWFGNKLYIIEPDTISLDAQTTLLKTIEEPHQNNFFIFSIKNANELSAPLLSRLWLFELPKIEEKFEDKISSSSKISSLKKDLENVPMISKEREDTELLLQNLEIMAESRMKTTSEVELKRLLVFVEDLLQIKSRFYQKTYFNKMLLDHLLVSKAYLKG